MFRNKRYIKGNSKSRLYKIWLGIKARCYRKSCKNYESYGGRGIVMYELWKNNYVSFYNWARRNGYNCTLSIERIDVNGNYEPSNCKWIPRSEQSKNTRKTIYLTYKGVTKILADWARELNVKYSLLYSRRAAGWTDAECIEGKHVAK